MHCLVQILVSALSVAGRADVCVAPPGVANTVNGSQLLQVKLNGTATEHSLQEDHQNRPMTSPFEPTETRQLFISSTESQRGHEVQSSHALQGSLGIQAKLHQKNASRFPFDLVFFQHIPKSGGTAMRDAVQFLCESRGQALMVCYNNISCINTTTWYGMRVAVAAPILGTVPWTPPNVNVENQVVYGHGLLAGFEEHWGLIPSSRNAWIRVVREPVPLLISLWSFTQRVLKPLDKRGHSISLDEWIYNGNAEACADGYMAYFVDLRSVTLEIGSDCHSDLPPTGKHPIIKRDDNISLLTAAVQSLQAPNSLSLLHGRAASLDRLSAFLDLSQEERAGMSGILSAVKNGSPPEELRVQRHNLDRLVLAAEPLQFIFDEVSRMNEGTSDSLIYAGPVDPKVQIMSEVGNDVVLRVFLD